MFKIVSETRVILDVMRKSVMNDLLSGSVARFTSKGLITSSSFGTYGCFADYKPEHFNEFLVDVQTDMCINQLLLKNFEEMGFMSDVPCQIESDLANNRLLVVSGSKRWMPNLSNANVETVGFPDSGIKLSLVEGIGYLPVTARPIMFQAKVNTDKLSIPRSGDFLAFYPLDKTLRLKWDMDGPAEMDVPLAPENVSVPHVSKEKEFYTFHQSYIKKILANLKGDITITFYEKSIIFNQVSPSVSLMYFIATI